jgi:predicted MFS family arabinose efflux permease
LAEGLSASVGSTALALIGLFNIAGSYYAGLWGGRYPKPYLLAAIYGSRALAIAIFLFFPITVWTVYIFAALMGLLWLSTVPLTNGTVASMFGVANMSMLGGVVFLFHQIGAFLGGWLGGLFFDQFGSYDITWIISIALGVIAALINIPIEERPLKEREAMPQ